MTGSDANDMSMTCDDNRTNASRSAKYPLGIVARMLEAGIKGLRNGYDIGCAFQGTLDRSSLGPLAKDAEIDFGLNSFHGYGHNRLCQILKHPLFQLGFGLEDLETCERFFSAFNAVAPLVRHASHYHYQQFIDLFLQQWDEDKYSDISKRFISLFWTISDALQASSFIIMLPRRIA